jgi:anti-sigma B factor antagonist
MELEIETQRRAGRCIVAPRGDVDLASNAQLRAVIDECVVAGDVDLVVDLTGVTFLDSTGLGALIGARRKTHAFRGSLLLVCGEEKLLKLFEITGLDNVFEIHASLDQALPEPAA